MATEESTDGERAGRSNTVLLDEPPTVHPPLATMASADRAISRLRTWGLFALAPHAALLAAGRFREIGETLVALGIAFVVPLGTALAIDRRSPSKLAELSAMMVPVGSALGLAAFAVGPGALSGLLAGGWWLATLVIAMLAVARITRRGMGPIEELAIDAGHLYLPVGATWLVASRAGMPLLGFHEPIVLYTANHFHFAGFAAPLVAGMLGRELALRRAPGSNDALAPRFVRGWASLAIAVVIVGVPLVALGIVVSHSLEMPAAFLLGTGMLSIALLLGKAGWARIRSARVRPWTGVLLVLAGAALVLSMGFAVVFASTGSATRGSSAPLVAYSTMALVHGVANAVGFASMAIVAFALSEAPRRSGPFAGSWPRLFGSGFIGPDFFVRRGAVDAGREVLGQIAHLDDFAHAGFRPDRVDPGVRAFYERTAEYELVVDPEWHPPFALAARAFAWFARTWLGQLELPVEKEGHEVVSTELFGVRDELDGRTGCRGYVRTYGEGEHRRANYVASYSTHRSPDLVFLSCAFPLPFGSLLAVLRFDDGDVPGGLVLRSHPREGDGPGDEGMFFVTKIGPVRLPVDESIAVYRGDDGELAAVHATSLCGLRCFTLRYRIEPIATRAAAKP